MAAEKLTRSRFIQICFLLSVLITAFFWKTYTFDGTDRKSVICTNNQHFCEISFNKNNNDLSIKSTIKNGNEVTFHLLGDINNPTLSVKSNQINSVNNPIKLLKTAEEWHSETIHLHVKEAGTILDLDIKIGSETYLAKFIIKPVH